MIMNVEIGGTGKKAAVAQSNVHLVSISEAKQSHGMLVSSDI
jgi:hypothetical protein